MCQHAKPEESWADVLNKTGTQCFCWPSFLWTVSKFVPAQQELSQRCVFLELLHSAKYFMFTESGNQEACPFLWEVEVTYNRCEPFQRSIFKGYETLCWVLNHISSTVGMYSSTEAGCCDPSSLGGNGSNTNNQMETAEGKIVIFLWKWWIQTVKPSKAQSNKRSSERAMGKWCSSEQRNKGLRTWIPFKIYQLIKKKIGKIAKELYAIKQPD